MLKFESEYLREIFQVKLTTFLKQNDIKENLNSSWTIKMALKEAVTKEKRQHRLEMFFRVVFAQVLFNYNYLSLIIDNKFSLRHSTLNIHRQKY